MISPFESPEPLFPREMRPVVCQERYCLYELEGSEHAPKGTVGYFVHEHDGIRAHFGLTRSLLADPYYDIWGEIIPWIERLHAEGA